MRLLADVASLKSELRGKVRELGKLVEVGAYGNVEQWFYRERHPIYDVLVHDIGLADHLPIYIDTTIYPEGWEISIDVREGGSREALRELLRELGIQLEDDQVWSIHASATRRTWRDIAPAVQDLVDTIATATEVPE